MRRSSFLLPTLLLPTLLLPTLLLTALFLTVLMTSPVAAQVDPHACQYCHNLHGSGGGAIPLTSFNLDSDLCMSCHDDAAPAMYDGKLVPKGVAVHAGSKHSLGPPADITSCTDCHGHFGGTQGNLKLIQRNLASKYPLPTGGTKTIVFTARTGLNSFADGDTTYDGVCEVCHTQTVQHRNDGSVSQHNAQANCTNCHTHSTGFAPSGCTGCHNQAQPVAAPTRRAIVPEFGFTSHHINWQAAGYASAQAIPDAQCQVCHDQSTHQSGVVRLKDVDTPANGPYLATNAAHVATFCVTCHDANGANGAAPFADGLMPPVIDGTKWAATGHGTRMTSGACLECHGSGHGKQKVDLLAVCDTCHGAALPPLAYQSLAKYAKTHVDPNNATFQWELPCFTCHTPHYELPNRYNFPPYVAVAGDTHPHNDTADATGGNAAGINIKLLGRNEDGSGIAKMKTPLRIIGEGAAGPCTASNIELQVAIPPYSFGDGPAHTVMVGDRITFSNAGADFTGVYRVKETVWNNLVAVPPTGWVCIDHPNPAAATTGFGYLGSAGWYQKPLVSTATWASGTATLKFSGPHSINYGLHSIQVGDWINVMNVSLAGFNGRQQVTAVTETSVSYTVTDPGAPGTGGEVEYGASVKDIPNMALQGPPPNPPLTVTGATWFNAQGNKPARAEITVAGHPYQVNDSITVSGINPAGYNGTFTVWGITTNTILYALPTNPGNYVSGGQVPDTSGGGTYTVLLTLNANNNDASILNIKAASGAPRDGDIVTIYGSNPPDYDGRYEVETVDVSVNPPTVTLRCAPFLDTAISKPFCFGVTMPAYIGGAVLQSSGSMRAVVYESRGVDNTMAGFRTDWTHSFTNTDNDADGWMDGPCELCHTLTSNHQNDDYNNTHNNGKTCTASCHGHSVGFDKSNAVCPRAAPGCPAVN